MIVTHLQNPGSFGVRMLMGPMIARMSMLVIAGFCMGMNVRMLVDMLVCMPLRHSMLVQMTMFMFVLMRTFHTSLLLRNGLGEFTTNVTFEFPMHPSSSASVYHPQVSTTKSAFASPEVLVRYHR